MISRLFGPGSRIGMVKADLDASHQGLMENADRIANLGSDLDADEMRALGLNEEAIEVLMARNADYQLRIEAGLQLLTKSYDPIRTAIREHG